VSFPFSGEGEVEGTAHVHRYDFIHGEESEWEYRIDESGFGLTDGGDAEFGIVFGGGVDMDLKRVSVILEVRYSVTLSETEFGSGRVPRLEGNRRNLTFSIGVAPSWRTR
jgi:hypothetical protein